MSENTISSPPETTGPDTNWKHYELYVAVKKAIYSLPSRFESPYRPSINIIRQSQT